MKPIILLSLIASTFSQNINYHNQTSNRIDTTGTIYHNLNKKEADKYYENIEEGLKGDVLLSSLQSTLKKGQKKLNYNSGDSTSTDWHGYYLYERNYDLSPLEESELNGKYKTSGIWINSLYSTSPIYIETRINKGGYKYYDEKGEVKEGTFGSKGGQFDREHVFPKSFGFNYQNDSDGYKKLTAGCDAHNLNIGEHAGNSSGHSNLPYGNVVIKDKTTEIRSTLNDEIVGYRGNNKDGLEVFEPLDKDKGNIARTIFYMAARYHEYEELSSTDKTPALALGDNIESDPKKTISPEETKENPGIYGQLSDLLEWNILDPVDKYEIHRNNLIYNAVQFNRNPFVDYPSWAEACFNPNNSEGIKFDDFQSVDNVIDPNVPSAKYELTLTTNNKFKKTYDCFTKFDPTGYEVELLKDGEKIASPNFSLYAGDQILTDSYMILGIGDMEIQAVVEIDNKTIYSSNTVTITMELSKTQIIIIAVVGVVLLLLIIWFITWAKKKKNRKKVKYLENKVEKIYKKSKKKKK